MADLFYGSGVLLLCAKLLTCDEVKKHTRRKKRKTTVLIILATLVVLIVGVWASHALNVPRHIPPSETDLAVNEIREWTRNRDEQQRLLAQYPLGYTIFDVNAVSGAVSPPYLTRQGPQAYEFDVRPVRIITNTSNYIEIQLPDLLRDGKPILQGAKIGGDKNTMQMYGAGYAFRDGDSSIWGEGRVLQYKGDQVFWIFGLRRAPSPVPNK